MTGILKRIMSEGLQRNSRTVVKVRMERAGMCWVFEGADVMMGLRSIHLSDLWNNFFEYRIGKEQARLYPGNAANDDLSSVLLAA